MSLFDILNESKGGSIVGKKIKYLVLASTFAILLGACSSANDLEENQKSEEETTQAEKVSEQEVQPASDIATQFETEVTFVTELTTADRRLREKLERSIEKSSASDRETIAKIAPEYDMSPDELWNKWIEMTEGLNYGESGFGHVIRPIDMTYLALDVAEAIYPGSEITYTEMSGEWDNMTNEFPEFNGSFSVTVNNIPKRLLVNLSLDKATEEVRLTSLIIDGEYIKL